MPKIKAVFDTDILIHLVKTKSIYIVSSLIETIYVSKFVYEAEIRKDTPEGKEIEKLKNIGVIKILEYDKLTPEQKNAYNDVHKVLKGKPFINEGERISACFAKAHNVCYYMSDDNNAAPHIKSLAGIDVVNYCDILYMDIYVNGLNKVQILKQSYIDFIKLFFQGKEPWLIKDNTGNIEPFENVMLKCKKKFDASDKLSKLAEAIKAK